MSLGLHPQKVFFVHGIFGWGPGELPFSYWGDALDRFKERGFDAHEVKCGPVSSFHDRACELFAQIKGGDFIYDPKHNGTADDGSKRAVVRRDERSNVADPLFPQWSQHNPIVLVGHSAGAHTCLKLQRLLAEDYFRIGSNADWISAIVCISGVLNGSTLAYMFGCDLQSGVLTGHPERLIGGAVEIANHFAALPIANIDLWLEQWVDRAAFVGGKDNLAYDLTLAGCFEANRTFQSNPNTFYLSNVTSMPAERKKLVGIIPLPRVFGGMNFLLAGPATYQAELVDFTANETPLTAWGTKPELQIGAWRENDGAVSSISQRLPFTHHAEPLGGEGFYERATLERGKWYFERVENVVGQRFDHLDPGFGAKMKWGVVEAQHRLYTKLAELLS
jgi:triacylglycerol lipase